MQYLEENGIRPILNYAAEDDVSAEPEEATSCPHAAAERCLDRNTAIFMRSIRDSDNFGNRAFVAIKVTLSVSSPVPAARHTEPLANACLVLYAAVRSLTQSQQHSTQEAHSRKQASFHTRQSQQRHFTSCRCLYTLKAAHDMVQKVLMHSGIQQPGFLWVSGPRQAQQTQLMDATRIQKMTLPASSRNVPN